jgi:hypothetical protein
MGCKNTPLFIRAELFAIGKIHFLTDYFFIQELFNLNALQSTASSFRNYQTQMNYYQAFFHSNLKISTTLSVTGIAAETLANCNSWPEIGNTSEKGKTIERW